MASEPDPRLAEQIHRALRQLPDLAAPRTLLPRVLAALPWWRRAWWHWPLAAQAAFLALALALAALLSSGGLWFHDGVAAYSQEMTARLGVLGTLADTLAVLLKALLVLAAKLADSPLLLYALALGAALYLACVGVGTLCVRLALKRA
jgi:hypothetical protein